MINKSLTQYVPQALHEEMANIAKYMREVVCEILLRDVEGLVDRYLQKTRKVSHCRINGLCFFSSIFSIPGKLRASGFCAACAIKLFTSVCSACTLTFVLCGVRVIATLMRRAYVLTLQIMLRLPLDSLQRKLINQLIYIFYAYQSHRSKGFSRMYWDEEGAGGGTLSPGVPMEYISGP